MRVASWNVNSIKARYDRFLNWIERREPDIVCLQELKDEGEGFPWDELGELGYYAEILGQKTYNGVAIVSREPIEGVQANMQDGVDDPQARLIAGHTMGVHVVGVYVPNGGEMGSDKWAYKLRWYARLRAWLDAHADPTAPLVLCGDFNVAPDERDVGFPELWADGVLCAPEARAALQTVVDWGLVDTMRALSDAAGQLTWWDYRRLGFQKGNGLRIDMVYATECLAAAARDHHIDLEERRGERPSDHAPVWTDFDA